MSDRLHFVPWLRAGLATQIDRVAAVGLVPGNPVEVTIQASVRAQRTDGAADDVVPLGERTVALHGPGDVVGFNPAEILRRTPEPGADDAERNYFAAVELRSADLPWRYTPGAPDGRSRLQPWLALVVVEDRPGVTLRDTPGRLAVLSVDDAARELPPVKDVWAWAHAQIDSDSATVDPEVAWTQEPSSCRSRLMCPRLLTPDTAWIACLVPTYEAGRLAGLGTPGSSDAGPAWSNSGAVELPAYDAWRFSTAQRGDFEYLVRKLVPRELPPEVGVRDLDLRAPGDGLPSSPDAVLSFLGALVSPSAAPRAWDQEHRRAIRGALRSLLVAPARDEEQVESVPDPEIDVDQDYDPLSDDPVVRPAVYGSAQTRLVNLPPRTQHPWFVDLNLDPPHRSVAGVGAAVVRMDQERLMDAAWDAAVGLADVNRRLNAATLALVTGEPLAQRLSGLGAERLLSLAGPSLARVGGDKGTLLADLRRSSLPDAATLGAFRRQLHPGGAIAQRLDVTAPAAEVTQRFSAPLNEIHSYQRASVPAGCDVADLSASESASQQHDLALLEPTALRDLDLVEGRYVVREQPPARGPFSKVTERRRATGPRSVLVAHEPGKTAARELVAPVRTRGVLAPTPQGDRLATRTLDRATGSLQVRPAIAQRLRATITAPGAAWTSDIPAAMWATPSFPDPVYERVRALDVEYLVPGVGEIPEDTIGLLETNDAYVEAVMVGANHELSREFLWREYPAQLHHTWFRQFWHAPLPDIAPIGLWKPELDLGAQDGSPQPDLVLVIKGAFPRRYPDVRVYAQRARWDTSATAPHPFRDVDPSGPVLSPVLAGELQPGVVFYGFALDEDTARGSVAIKDADPGWFFVLEEQPRGVRFGLDEGVKADAGSVPESWDDLTWAHVVKEGAEEPPRFVSLSVTRHLDSVRLEGAGGTDVWADDPAALARITLQRPVQVKAHASGMLPEPGADR